MVIGYVTLEEANDYVATHFTSTSTQRIAWEALSDEDKEVLLRVSAEAIDSIPYPGRKASATQTEAFPRWPQTEVPQAVKHAQVENALIATDEQESEYAAMYQRMRAFGVQSYEIDDLSETIVTGTSSGVYVSKGITSPKAQSLLAPFLGGAYRI